MKQIRVSSLEKFLLTGVSVRTVGLHTCPPVEEQPQASGADGSDDVSANPVSMHKINDIGNFVGRFLSERDRKTLLVNSWTPSSSYDFPVVHTGLQKRRFQMQNGWWCSSG